MMLVPSFRTWTRSASRNSAKCADMVDFDSGNASANSPAVIGPARNNSSTRRRVGSASALNTRFMFRYLAK